MYTRTLLVLVCLSALSVVIESAPRPIPYMIGYITKDTPANGQTIAGWLGRKLDVLGTTITMSSYWISSIPKTYHVAAAVPMLSIAGWDSLNAVDMAKAASGDYDEYYKNMAKSLANGPAPVLSVRFGWEMNGNWYPWSVGGPGGFNSSHANYIATFKRMANIFRETIPGVKIEFCTNFAWNSVYSNASGTPLDYWPGSQYVDIISMDFYQSSIGGEWSTAQSKGTYNLDWLVSFAKAQGVKVGLSEWGATHDDGSYISGAANWMNSLGKLFAYQMYSQYAPADQVVNPGENPLEQAAWIAAWKDTYYEASSTNSTVDGIPSAAEAAQLLV